MNLAEFPANMTENDRIIYKPIAFKGNTVYIYEASNEKLTPEQLITLIMSLVDEDVQAQKTESKIRLKEKRRELD